MGRRAKVVTLALLALLLVAAAVALLTHRTEGQTFVSSGASIHFTDEGSGDPVVLLHGFAVNADLNWRRPGITAGLARTHRVISMDLRGHGLSAGPHDPAAYGLKMVDDVVALLDHLGLPRAHVVGYSLGGFIALKLAVLHPDRVKTVAALGSGWERPERSAFLNALARMALDLQASRPVGPISAELGGARKKPGPLHTLWVRVMTEWFNDPLALAAMLRALPALGITETELSSLRLPVCSIVGENDPLLMGLRNMEGKVPGLVATVIPGADHLQATMRPELLKALTEFLDANAETVSPR